MSDLYFERYAFKERLIEETPSDALGIIITIPCFNEPDLIASLKSIKSCQSPNCDLEVIVLINHSERASADIIAQNESTLKEAIEFAGIHSSDKLKFFILLEELPDKHAGVGLARKIAMDEAARRFNLVNKPEGVIVCFDADSDCDNNYLVEIEKYFNANPNSPGCSIHFEHPINGGLPDDNYIAIIEYEIFLRYYINALKYAGFPHAHQTIGSSMAVRSKSYLKQGGMNKRKAGEDFYFLNKIIPLNSFGELTSTRVIPSPRTSERVPFGTGKAINDWMNFRKIDLYNFQTFIDLKELYKWLNELDSHQSINVGLYNLSPPLQSYLNQIDFESNIKRIVKNSASISSFKSNFHQWFDAFKLLKLVHWMRDHVYSNVSIEVGCSALFNYKGWSYSINIKEDWLIELRKRDRGL